MPFSVSLAVPGGLSQELSGATDFEVLDLVGGPEGTPTLIPYSGRSTVLVVARTTADLLNNPGSPANMFFKLDANFPVPSFVCVISAQSYLYPAIEDENGVKMNGAKLHKGWTAPQSAGASTWFHEYQTP